MDLSIIIPAYNSEEFISSCLDSILSQKFDYEFEIIVVNDGSTDKTLGILKKYKNKIRIISQPNQGVTKARKNGVIASKGKYIMFVDSDDMLRKNTLNNFFNKIYNSDIDILIGGYIEKEKNTFLDIFLKKYQNLKITRKQYINMLLRQEIHWGPYARLIKKELLLKTKVFDEIPNSIFIGEDAIMNMSLARHIKNVMLVDVIIYEYIRHKSSLMFKQFNFINEKHFTEFIKLMTQGLDENIYNNSILHFKILMWIFYRKNGMKIVKYQNFQNSLYCEIKQNTQMAIIKKNKLLLWWLATNNGAKLYYYLMVLKNKIF